MIISVITGDIIKSQVQQSPKIWLDTLKETLNYLSSSKLSWRLSRGDSFQMEIQDISQSFVSAVYIMASLKAKGLDVRLAIGIGEKTYEGENVSESNGEAFIFSGETLEKTTKQKQNLLVKTKIPHLNAELNLYFRLILIAINRWTTNLAEIVKLSLEQPSALQSELGEIIGINQNAVSTRQKRAHFDEILELDRMYKRKIAALL